MDEKSCATFLLCDPGWYVQRTWCPEWMGRKHTHTHTHTHRHWGLLALRRWTFDSERHRYAIARPDKLGTDPTAVDGINGRRRAESGVNLVSKHHIQPECGEWAGWRGTVRLNPSCEAKFSGANEDRENVIFHVHTTTSRIGNLYPVDSYSARGDDSHHTNTYSLQE